MKLTNIDNLAGAILEELQSYSEEVTTKVKKAVDVVAKEVNAEIKNHITFKEHTHEYVKAFRIKKVTDSQYNSTKTWHVSGGQYRLTHLLEKGHATRNGGRTKAYKHIEYGEELAIKRMQELTKEAIENAGH